MSKSYVSKLENHPDKCNPTINLILKIAKELGLNPFFVFRFFIKNRK
ncbi:helix-turn-helix domain-containing protein [Clostridium botulinum]|nr:helix-turn-helix transcriptional regulator [Clostridium botulinum]MCR1132288.1 helix-turn-helix domain-containing protein [Clostridium botulinum]